MIVYSSTKAQFQADVMTNDIGSPGSSFKRIKASAIYLDYLYVAGYLEKLDTLFESHQRSLLAKDIDATVSIFTEFQTSLLRHIGFEETVLLPKYAQEGGETAGGTLQIFQAEHRKLQDMTDKLAHEGLDLYDGKDLDAHIIAIFDHEALFKGLLDHHTHREQNILVPRLKARTTTEDQLALAEQHDPLDPALTSFIQIGSSGTPPGH